MSVSLFLRTRIVWHKKYAWDFLHHHAYSFSDISLSVYNDIVANDNRQTMTINTADIITLEATVPTIDVIKPTV